MAAAEKWARMKPVKKGESFSEEVQGKVKALRDRYKRAVDGKMTGIYGLPKEGPGGPPEDGSIHPGYV